MCAFRKIQLTLVLLAVMAGNTSAIVVSGKKATSWPEVPCLWPGGPDEEPVAIEYGNVGKIGSASGVYLGDGWVLTAKHVGANDITFGDTTYQYDGESAVSIKNPTGVQGLNSVYTDLTLFHLSEEPDLPAINISSESPAPGSTVFYVGYGGVGEDEISYWTVSGDYVWTESVNPTYYWGYKIASRGELSWGYNTTFGNGDGPLPGTHIVSANQVDIVAVKTGFNSQDLDSQAASGDSGGALFSQDSEGNWGLAGIISCVEVLQNSPTQAMVDSTTCSVALSFYRDQILDIITPQPIPGDANGDGVVDGSDVTILAGNWQQSTNLGAEVGDF